MEQNYNYNYNNQYNEQPRAKKGKIGTVIALVAAVAIIGSGAGFGGAYLASKSIGIIGGADGPTTIITDDSDKHDNVSENDDKPSDDSDGMKDNGGADGDIAGALSAINNSAGSGAEKIHPYDVVATGVNGEYTTTELYEAVNDTVVLVKVYTNAHYNDYYSYYDYYFGYSDPDEYEKEEDKEPVYSGYGSGVVFTEDGYILTNAHVVDGAEKLIVEVNDYNKAGVTYEYEATVVGSDESTDIAVIKISRDEPFVAAIIGDSNTLKVGQDVCAIGNPGVTGDVMFEHTMTKGIISGLNRVSLSEGYSLSLIQTDTAINSGNSGGGLFDMYGNVVGVVNSKIVTDTYEGIGFALTINEAKPIMEDLLSYGYVKSRPVLGIITLELNEYRAELYGVRISKGLLVSEIRQDAEAAKSDLRVSDVITKINGVNVETVSDVQSIISKFKAGDTVTATVARANGTALESIEVDIVLSESNG